MLASTSSLRPKVFVALFLIASSTWYLSQSRQDDEVIRPFSHLQQSPKESFIETALRTTVGDKFDNTAIKALCANTTWTDGLIFQCDPPKGGIGNVENFVLSCVRFAIEAGGMVAISSFKAELTYLQRLS